MQTLLQDPPGIDQLTAMADRSQQRLDAVGLGAPASALAQQPNQSCAVAVVGLDPSRPQLPAAAVVSDGANNRSDPGQRRSISAAHARCSDPVASKPITGGPSPRSRR